MRPECEHKRKPILSDVKNEVRITIFNEIMFQAEETQGHRPSGENVFYVFEKQEKKKSRVAGGQEGRVLRDDAEETAGPVSRRARQAIDWALDFVPCGQLLENAEQRSS